MIDPDQFTRRDVPDLELRLVEQLHLAQAALRRLGVAELVSARWRELVDDAYVDGELQRQGWPELERDVLYNLLKPIPGPGDLVTMAVREAFSPAQIEALGLGAEFPAELRTEKIDQIFEKGTGNKDDGYSAFEATNYNLAEYLKEKKIDELFVTGLTAEYCVKSTVIDALKHGIKTFVIKEAVEGIRAHEDDFENSFL